MHTSHRVPPVPPQTPEEFERRTEDYFARCEAEGRPVLFTGLVMALGLSDKQAFARYAAREDFAAVAGRARLRIEERYEQILQASGASGAVFALKNFDWTDKPAHPEGNAVPRQAIRIPDNGRD